MIQASSSHK